MQGVIRAELNAMQQAKQNMGLVAGPAAYGSSDATSTSNKAKGLCAGTGKQHKQQQDSGSPASEKRLRWKNGDDDTAATPNSTSIPSSSRGKPRQGQEHQHPQIELTPKQLKRAQTTQSQRQSLAPLARPQQITTKQLLAEHEAGGVYMQNFNASSPEKSKVPSNNNNTRNATVPSEYSWHDYQVVGKQTAVREPTT
jgi:hypothetical protein